MGAAWLGLLIGLGGGFDGGAQAAEAQICTNNLARVYVMREGNIYNCYIANLQGAPITATVDMQLTNMKAEVTFPFTQSVPGNVTAKAFKVWPVNTRTAWRYRWTNAFTFGSVNARHDDSHVYALPYASGKSFRVIQGYGGKFSHFGDNLNAIDWSMPEGTVICAARGGKVVAVKDDSTRGGPGREFEGCANYVMIEHADRTIGHYAHLQPGGVKVKPGDVVKTGDPIALSGNTGWSSRAHLHFAVFKAKDGQQRETFRTKFRTAGDPMPVSLEERKSYEAVPLAAP